MNFDNMPHLEELTVITSLTEVYDYSISSSTPVEYKQEYYYIPFFAWVIISILIFYFSSRIFYELLERLRK